MITQVQLTVVEAVATHAISQHEMENIGFQQYITVRLPQELENMVLSMVSLFAADNIQNIKITTPINWWEHLKQTHAPAFFLKRWPVKSHTRTVDIKAIWAGYKPPTDKWGPMLPYVLDTSDSYGLNDDYDSEFYS